MFRKWVTSAWQLVPPHIWSINLPTLFLADHPGDEDFDDDDDSNDYNLHGDFGNRFHFIVWPI